MQRSRRSRSRSPERKGDGDRLAKLRKHGSPDRPGLGYSRSEDKQLNSTSANTVMCSKLSQQTSQRDLEAFFSSVGKVVDVHIIRDNLGKSKSIAYVQFEDRKSTDRAALLTGQHLLGCNINVIAVSNIKPGKPVPQTKSKTPFGKLYVGSLHFKVTESMLKDLFEPFGKLEFISMVNDSKTGKFRGFAFVKYADPADANTAVTILNGVPLCGRAMKIQSVDGMVNMQNMELIMKMNDKMASKFASDNKDDEIVQIPENLILSPPKTMNTALSMAMSSYTAAASSYPAATAVSSHAAASSYTSNRPSNTFVHNLAATFIPNNPSSDCTPIQATPSTSATSSLENKEEKKKDPTFPGTPSQCLLASNMFDPTQQSSSSDWVVELCDDVIEEITSYGGKLVHIFADQVSPEGNIYMKATNFETAWAVVRALHGRFFDGRLIKVDSVPITLYHRLFPKSQQALDPIEPPSKKSAAPPPARRERDEDLRIPASPDYSSDHRSAPPDHRSAPPDHALLDHRSVPIDHRTSYVEQPAPTYAPYYPQEPASIPPMYPPAPRPVAFRPPQPLGPYYAVPRPWQPGSYPY